MEIKRDKFIKIVIEKKTRGYSDEEDKVARDYG